MGSPTIWWYPDTIGTLQTDTLPEAITNAHEEPYWDRAEDAVSLSGAVTLQPLRMGMRVRLVVENFTDESLVSMLYNVNEHLRRGRHIGFAADVDKAWCSYLTTLPSRADTTVDTGGNVWWTTTTGAIADNEYLMLESANPDGTRQRLKKNGAASATATTLTVDEVLLSPGLMPAWMRSELYWPLLYLPDDQLSRPLLTSNWRRMWTWDVELEFHIEAMARMVAHGGSVLNLGSTQYAGTAGALEEVLNKRMDHVPAYRTRDVNKVQY